MSNVPTLLTAGHRLCHALLTEANVAVVDNRWTDAVGSLGEFQWYIERLCHAEETLLFPRLAHISESLDAALGQSRREHRRIARLLRLALDGAHRHEPRASLRLLARLIDFLSCHCVHEERFIYRHAEAWDEDLVWQLADCLSARRRPDRLQ